MKASYVIGGLVAAEAFGVTNLSKAATSGDTQVSIEAPERPSVPTVPDSGPSDAVLAALAQSGDSGPSAADIAAATGGGGGGATETVINLVNETKEKAGEAADEARDRAEDADPRNDGGGGGGNGGRTRGGDGGGGDGDYTLQDDYNGAFSEYVKGGAETLEQTGNVVSEGRDAPGDAASFAGKTGETVREAGKLLLTGEADTSNTHARDRGRVGLDFSGDGETGGNLSARFDGIDPVGDAAEDAGKAVREKLGGWL